jgi:heat shock protein HslJ
LPEFPGSCDDGGVGDPRAFGRRGDDEYSLENRADIPEPPMRLRPATTLAVLTLVAAACNPVNPGAPLMPGSVNAPPPPMTAAGDALLTDTLWSWKETVMSGDKRTVPDAPDRYTLLFQPGGMVAVRADCNGGSGSYALNGDSLSFGPLAMTRAMCPRSKDADFLAARGGVGAFRGNDLMLTLKPARSMLFTSPRQ